MDRIDKYFRLLEVIAERATCDRGRSGCIIADSNDRILTVGWVDAPRGEKTCDSSGHKFDESGKHCIRTIHAEQNAIASAARKGVALEGSVLFCTMTPCHICTKIIIEAGIKEVFCAKKYKKPEYSELLFEQAGIKVHYQSTEVMKY